MWIKGSKSDTVINLDKCSYIDFVEARNKRILARFHTLDNNYNVIGVPNGMSRQDFISSIMSKISNTLYYEVEEG